MIYSTVVTVLLLWLHLGVFAADLMVYDGVSTVSLIGQADWSLKYPLESVCQDPLWQKIITINITTSTPDQADLVMAFGTSSATSSEYFAVALAYDGKMGIPLGSCDCGPRRRFPMFVTPPSQSVLRQATVSLEAQYNTSINFRESLINFENKTENWEPFGSDFGVNGTIDPIGLNASPLRLHIQGDRNQGQTVLNITKNGQSETIVMGSTWLSNDDVFLFMGVDGLNAEIFELSGIDEVEMCAPTASPTHSPTLAPTDLPTTAPTTASPTTAAPTTKSPTAAPTLVPTTDTNSPTPSTDQPSQSPTRSPTKVPSDAPTASPTDVPTESPTDLPSQTPTTEPSHEPTSEPTINPTRAPTQSPTFSPTKQPTNMPSDAPTDVPTGLPTDAPSDVPTASPTKLPTTGAPTASPTDTPSDAPTTEPSFEPTREPTASTNTRTLTPSDAPTNIPSDSPTKAPTFAPTTETGAPTSAPTESTTNITPPPTNAPTDLPTNVPTDFPTESPTDVPSDSPSGQPTEAPTSLPSKTPTHTPSGSPISDTTAPTDAPTNVPSSSTINPTLRPTSTPTNIPSATPTPTPTTAATAVPTTSGNPTAPTHLPTLPTYVPVAPTSNPSLTPTAPTSSPTATPTTPTEAPTTGAPTAVTTSPAQLPSVSPTAGTNAPTSITLLPTSATESPTGAPTNVGEEKSQLRWRNSAEALNNSNYIGSAQCNFSCWQCLQQMDVIAGGVGDDWQFTFREIDDNDSAQDCACPVLHGAANATGAANAAAAAAASNGINRVVIDEEIAADDGTAGAYDLLIEKLSNDDIRATVHSWMGTVNLTSCVAHYAVNQNSLFGVQSDNVLVITFTVCDADATHDETYYEDLFRGIYSTASSVTAQIEWLNSPYCVPAAAAAAAGNGGSSTNNANSNRRVLLQSSSAAQNDQQVTVVIVFTDAADATQATKEGACDAAAAEIEIVADSCVVSTVDETAAAQITAPLTSIASVFGSVHVAVVAIVLVAISLLVCCGASFYARWKTNKLVGKNGDRAQVMTTRGGARQSRMKSQRTMRFSGASAAVPNTPTGNDTDKLENEGVPAVQQPVLGMLQTNVSRKVIDVEMKPADSNMPYGDKTAAESNECGLALTGGDTEEIVTVGADGIGKLSAVYSDSYEHKQQLKQVNSLQFGGVKDHGQQKPMSEEDMLDTVISSKNANEIFMDDLAFEKKAIGNGQFGVVYKATWNGNVVVVKQLNSEQAEEQETGAGDVTLSEQHQKQVAAKHEARRKEMTAEVLLASSLPPHSNLVEIFGYVKSPFAVVMSYMHGDSVQKFVYRASKSPSERIPSIPEVLIILRKAANGLKFLHQHNLVHRDIACRNILLGRIHNGAIDLNTEVRISDFGLTRQLDDDDGGNMTQSHFGPLKWMAPESIRHRQYSKKSDVYMFGITMWETFFGMEPYGTTAAFQIANGVVRHNLRPTLDMDRNEHRFTDIPEEYESLMRRCWHASPSQRPDLAEVVSKLSQIEESPRTRVP